MTIEELITIAEDFYGNDDEPNTQGSSLGLIKTHAEIAKNYFRLHPEIAADNITEIELLSIIMLEGFGSELIQTAAYDPQQINPVTRVLIESLDSALHKIQKNTEVVLYRNDSDDRDDINEYTVGQNITINGFFTTSKDDFDNAHSIKWIITPLSSEATKAHEIYRLYNHGSNCPYPEYQIEFERGATFVITAIENGDNFKTIHIRETES